MKNRLLLITMLFAFIGCKKDSDELFCGAEPPHLTLERAARAMIPYKPGDSIVFNVYKRKVPFDGTSYFFREEKYYVTDTFTELRPVNVGKSAGANPCDTGIPYQYYVVKFRGPSKLQCEISPMLDNSLLHIRFRGMDYEIDRTGFLYRYYPIQPKQTYGGKEYHNVESIAGVIDAKEEEQRGKPVGDSTHCYYNRTEGILKIIHMDTTTYIIK